MMARVALGHSGRPLLPRKSVVWAFGLMVLAAVVRVWAPVVAVSFYRTSIFLAGSLFVGAFLLFFVAYFPVLISPRADGKPG
jgi:uncharacterized protein involved in response to NO